MGGGRTPVRVEVVEGGEEGVELNKEVEGKVGEASGWDEANEVNEGEGEEVELTETWDEGSGSSSIKGLPPPPPTFSLLLLLLLLVGVPAPLPEVMVTVDSLLPEGNDNDGILTLTQLGLLSSCWPRRSSSSSSC